MGAVPAERRYWRAGGIDGGTDCGAASPAMVGIVEGAVCGPPRAVVARLGRPPSQAAPVANGSPGGPPAIAAAALVGISGGRLTGTAGGPPAIAAAALVGMSGGKLAGMAGGPPVIAVAALVGSSVLSSATAGV